MVAGNAEEGGLGRKKMRAGLILRYHECAEPREAHEKIKSNKIASNARWKSSEGQGGISARALAIFRSSPDADRQSSSAMPSKFEFFSRKLTFKSQKTRNSPNKYRYGCCIPESFIGN